MSVSPSKGRNSTPGARKSQIMAAASDRSPQMGGTEEGLEDLLKHLTEQAEQNAKPVGSARKEKHEKTLEEKRKDVHDLMEAEKGHHPRRKQWQGDAVSRQFCPIDAGYLVDLDPKNWKYETNKPRNDPNAKPIFRGPRHTSEEFGDCSDVPVTPALSELLRKNQKMFLAQVSRRRVQERLLPIPRAFDLQQKVAPWTAPPTECRFFVSPDTIDPVELQKERKVQAARFRDQTRK